jgi:hypothetical protein
MTVQASDQTRALVRTFLARFFENEITQGTDDLKASFFWLLSFLAAPAFMMPVAMMSRWALIALIQGPEVLRVVSRTEKVFYLGFSMIASAVVCAIAWNSILIDRRDALILGAIPVRAATIVRAKLAAVAAYVSLVAAGTHTLASVAFGLSLAAGSTVVFAGRGVVAHFLASFAASVFVFFGVAAVQGVCLAGLGPRLFARVSPALQLGLVALIVAGFLGLPTITMSAVQTLQDSGKNVRPWILSTPPLWFLGLYEWLLGTSDPKLLGLAMKAMLGLIAAILATAGSFPLAYRRVVATVVDNSAGFARVGRTTAVANALTSWITHNPGSRAVAQFFLATMGRVERHRFVMAVALGIAGTWGLPSWFALLPAPPREPRLDLLALPLAMMTFLLVGLRIAVSLPADPKAAWMFDVAGPTRRQSRGAIERIMIVVGVLPVVGLFGLVYAYLWGRGIAIVHGVVATSVGALLIQGLLWRFEGMPCARRWNPESTNWRNRWFLYVGGFMILTGGVAQVESLLFEEPGAAVLFVGPLLVAAWIIRHVALRQEAFPHVDVDAPDVGNVLSLS